MELKIINQNDLEQFKKELLTEVKFLLKEVIQEGIKKDWLTEYEACKKLDVSKSTIQNYRRNGVLPFSQFGNKIKYKRIDLQAFLESHYININLNVSKYEC
jgi:excisionase family DNA binding protein